MQEIKRRRAVAIGLRARLPMLTRVVALLVLVVGLIFVAVWYYKLRNVGRFVMAGKSPELSKEETGRVEGYEQRITKEGRLYLWLRASREITYADGHHEMENANIAIYPPQGEKPDQISANRAIYDVQQSTISFLTNVKIETKEALKLETDAVVYNTNTEVANTDALVNFTRENVSGHCTGAAVDGKAKTLQMKKDVEVKVAPETLKEAGAKPSSTRARPVTIHAGCGSFEQGSMKLTFLDGVTVEQEHDILSGDQMTSLLNAQKRLEKVELRGNSYLRTMEPGRAAEIHSTDMDFYLD